MKSKNKLQNSLINQNNYRSLLIDILKKASLQNTYLLPSQKGIFDIYNQAHSKEILSFFKKNFSKESIVFIESSKENFNKIQNFLFKNLKISTTENIKIFSKKLKKEKRYFFLFENNTSMNTYLTLWDFFPKKKVEHILNYSFLSFYFFEGLNSKLTDYLRNQEGLAYTINGSIDNLTYSNGIKFDFLGISSKPLDLIKELKRFYIKENSVDENYKNKIFNSYATKLIINQESFKNRVLKTIQEKSFNFVYADFLKKSPSLNTQYKDLEKSLTKNYSFFASGPKEQLESLKKAYPSAIWIKDPKKFLEEEMYKIL